MATSTFAMVILNNNDDDNNTTSILCGYKYWAATVCVFLSVHYRIILVTAMIMCCCIIPDINECITNNGGCEHNCTNTIGSYLCFCNIGFKLTADNHSCEGQ